MTGGQWVAHPNGQHVRFQVHYADKTHPITQGLEDFETVSEHYYLLVDPAVHVLATTRMPIGKGAYTKIGDTSIDLGSTYGVWNFDENEFNDSMEAVGPHITNGVFDMPVMWTKYFGQGRVFYNSCGHSINHFMEKPNLEVTRRALLWAAK